MTVYTFFTADPPATGQGQIIKHFHNSWSKRGWEVVMLNPRTYADHPDKEAYLAAAEKISDITDRQRALRYLALDAFGSHPAWLAEYDVVNFGAESWEEDPYEDSTNMMCGEGVMHLGHRVANKIVKALIAGRNPVFGVTPLHAATAYKVRGWDTYGMVHFNKLSCGDTPKHKVIETCGRFY